MYKLRHENDISDFTKDAAEAREEISALNLLLEQRDTELMEEQGRARKIQEELSQTRSELEKVSGFQEARDNASSIQLSSLKEEFDHQRELCLKSEAVVVGLRQELDQRNDALESLNLSLKSERASSSSHESRLNQLETEMQEQISNHQKESTSLISQLDEVRRQVKKVCNSSLFNFQERRENVNHVDRIRRLEYQLSESVRGAQSFIFNN